MFVVLRLCAAMSPVRQIAVRRDATGPTALLLGLGQCFDHTAHGTTNRRICDPREGPRQRFAFGTDDEVGNAVSRNSHFIVASGSRQAWSTLEKEIHRNVEDLANMS